MESDNIRNKMTLKQAAGQMMPYKYKVDMGVSWSNIVTLYRNSKIVGEVRVPDDWKTLPRDIYLRAIYCVDDQGPVIRWGNPDTMSSTLQGNLHAHLIRQDDNLTDIKSGWIILSKDGLLSVQP